MALLDIHELKSDLMRQSGGRYIKVRQALEIIVVQERISRIHRSCGSLVYQGKKIENGIVKGNQRALITISPRMGQLQTDHQVLIRAERLPVCLATDIQHALEIRRRFVIQVQLPGIGSSV